MPVRLSENLYNFYNGILSLRLLYHKSSRCKPTRRYAVFCRQTKDLMVKCSQTCGAPQAVLLHGKIRSRRILSLRLLYHKSSRCKPTRRYAVFCRQTKDLMVKCSQTCGAPQAVLLHGKIPLPADFKSEVIIPHFPHTRNFISFIFNE